MFFNKDLDSKIKENEKKLSKLLQEHQELDKSFQQVYSHLEVKPEQLRAFGQNSANFNSQNWEEMQKLKQQLQQESQLKNLNPSPLQTKKSFKNLNVPNYSIFVR